MTHRQLPLFGAEPEPAGSRAVARTEPLADVHADAARVAASLPDDVFFGTSSWSFPGWAGIVYREPRSQAALARDGLREYAQHPLLRTVGIDRSYYAPIPAEDLRSYAAQLPPGFRACAKAPASVMSAAMPGSPRRGGAVLNPTFLSARHLIDELIEPFAEHFADFTGPFVLECPAVPRDLGLEPRTILDALFEMLSRLPAGFTYAVELRDRRLLSDDYLAVLRATGAAHVYNHWSAMPALAAQAAVVPPASMPVVVTRLLLRPGTWYEDQRERFRPFDRLVEPDEAMRDDVVALIRASRRAQRPAFVLVNNKAEGSAPLTIRALAERVARDLGHAPSPPGG